jgi:small-conductance mechanosensitive channel
MIRIIFLLWVVFHATASFASGSLAMPDSPSLNSPPSSKEIKKITKLLGNPQEREKLLKTLTVLASAQEAEEKKGGGSLVHYIMPLIEFSMDNISSFFMNLKKIPKITNSIIDFFKVDKNREDFWTALKLFPLLMMIGALLEGILTWFFRWRLESRQPHIAASELLETKNAYAYMTLFYPFLYSLLFLPLFVSGPSIGNWIIGLWFILFAIRIFLLGGKTPFFASTSEQIPKTISRKGPFLKVLSGVGLWALLMSGLNTIFGIKSYGEDFVFNLILFISFPLLVLYFREWKVKEMPQYLKDSKTLTTVPHQMAPLINICIHYLPWLLLLMSLPLSIDRVFFGGSFWKAYSAQSLETLLVLVIFLGGRRHIDSLALYRLPKIQAFKIQAFTSYVAPLRFSFAKYLQWIWHISFFGILMAIWNNFFSSLFINVVSHPMTKIITTIAMIWGIIYLAWLGIDFFVQLHTKPQNIRGKRREPTVFAKTFGPMLHSVARWIMVLVAIFATLESLGFDLKILVYLMSAFAFAISLGSQSLVKDVINGFFALVDGSFSVGDVVTVGAHTGTVESLSLRSITLRHRNGSLQTIPFSEVGNIINQSRDYTLVPIDIAISYKTKIGSVYEALTKAVEEIAQDPVFGKMILEPLSLSGIDRFADNAVYVSASIKITPDPGHYFARELNRRVKIHMDALGIAPPISFQERWTTAEGN